jgi:hypothetical protein
VIRADPVFGTQLPASLARGGSVNIEAEVHAPLVAGGPVLGWVPLTLAQVHPRLIASRLLSEQNVDEIMACFADLAFRYPTPLVVVAWPTVACLRHGNVASDQR